MEKDERKELSENDLEKVIGGAVVKEIIKDTVPVPVRDDGVAFCPHCILPFQVEGNNIYTCLCCGRQYESIYWPTSMNTQWNEIKFVEKEDSTQPSTQPSNPLPRLKPIDIFRG